MKCRLTVTAVLLLLSALPAFAGEPEDTRRLKEELENIRLQYERQIRALEARIEALEAAGHEAGAGTTAPESRQADAAATADDTAAAGNAYNPALSLVLQGSINGYSADPDRYALPGFQTGGEAGLASEGATLDETELTASASVDHLFYAETTLALHEDEEDTGIEIEQAFFEPVMLPAGLGMRAGRFYSALGYLNGFHSHAWDFHDAPLAYTAFLGRQYRDDGIRLNWIAPTALYLNLGGELLAGNSFPAGSNGGTAGDAWTLFAETGGDIGTDHAWQAGLSLLQVDVNDRAGGHAHDGGDGTVFSGDSDLYVADLVWKWAPGGYAGRRSFKLQGEIFYREEGGSVTYTEGVDQALLGYDGHQYGYYLQGVYQFLPRWRTGLRYDRLSADNALTVTSLGTFTDPLAVLAASGLDPAGHRPERWSLMLDWSPSEFSRLRAQYNRDRSRPFETDHQWSLQYIMSLGAHGAHAF
jgi:hypothetical protein